MTHKTEQPLRPRAIGAPVIIDSKTGKPIKEKIDEVKKPHQLPKGIQDFFRRGY